MCVCVFFFWGGGGGGVGVGCPFFGSFRGSGKGPSTQLSYTETPRHLTRSSVRANVYAI